MLIALALPTEVSVPLQRLAEAADVKLDEAALPILREWLAAHGYLDAAEVDEETVTARSA